MRDVVGSNPTPATNELTRQDNLQSRSAFFIFTDWLIYGTVKIFCVMLLSFIIMLERAYKGA